MKYRYNYIIPYQDVDASRCLRLYTMENYLLNVAGKVADEMGFGIPNLLPMNYTWIITHMNMEMMFLPRHGEEIIIETWIERNAHMLSIRDFRIYTPQGDGSELLIGCAKSVWAVLDLTSREIVNIFDLPMFEGSVDGEVLNMARAARLHPILLDNIEDENGVTGEILHEIQYSDVDYNRHCNSCKYLEWMVNAVQAFDNQKPFRLDINYVKELQKGGHQLQLNAVDKEKLIAAQRTPERYSDLIVRVWGWSGHFVELPKIYQDQIIRRTEYEI